LCLLGCLPVTSSLPFTVSPYFVQYKEAKEKLEQATLLVAQQHDPPFALHADGLLDTLIG
jgi:hypothetical protein